jgi:phytoene synthase
MSSHIYGDSEDGFVLSTQGSTSFHYSFGFLPREEREAIRTIYAFARRIDDIVDDHPSRDPDVIANKRQRLQWWRMEVEAIYAGTYDHRNASLQALDTVVRRYTIPKQYLLTLIDGCERDLMQQRYQTFAELKEYCYGVASVIGLISIEIFGYRHEETRQYAINLGYALQLTNILRDVQQDKERGFIYLPLEDLERFHEARALLRPDERLTMVAAEIMDAIYYRLLEKIELNSYRVFQQRIRVHAIHKVVTALRIWLGAKLFVKRFR